MASQTEILNMALAVLGEAPVTSIDEDSTRARTCKSDSASRMKSLISVVRASRWRKLATLACISA